MALDPSRTVDELRELRELTGDENGAQRVAWTDTWRRAKEWLEAKLEGVPAEKQVDEAGNEWYTLRGASERAVVIGGHIDSVPNGGWLDGSLNVVAGVEVLRRIAGEGEPPVTVRLVNWADEEGARFGRSLFGSSAASGSMADQDELRKLRDADGIALVDALREHGVELDRATEARRQLEGTAAYLELHIEQGPVLESLDLPLGVVLGTFGVERHQITWRGQAAHSGSTPMDARRDALAGASKLAISIRDIAREVGGGGVCTSGGVVCKPGIVTSVVETAVQLLDQRHLDADKLARMLALAKEASERFAAEEDVEVEWEKLWSIEPILFDEQLIAFADEAVQEVAGRSHKLPSGPLHDAAEPARIGIPTVMLFVQSLRGLSHTRVEDTRPEHLELSVRALDRLAAKTIEHVARA
ncbi:MAG TPA: Zn-dependent hydrolase [Gaiellaceae bacterium]|nr:Zn-dependent hydrolase [Gaiellaceae bacterium]